jgi:hypothetical protein
MEYVLMFIAAVFVNNVVLAQFLGICPFLGVSKKIDTAIGMGLAVVFVLTVSTLFTFLMQKYLVDPLGLGFMETVSYFLVIAAGSSGRNHTKKSLTRFISSFRRLPSSYHNELLYSRSSNSGHPKRI